MTGMQRPTWPRALLALALVGAAPFIHIRTAEAGAAMSATSGYDGSSVSIASELTTTLAIANLNTPPDLALTLGPIFFLPSCGTTGPVVENCPEGSEDPGVVDAIAAAGSAGSACEGRQFTLVDSDAATGRVELTPDLPVVLGSPNEVCEIVVQVVVRGLPRRDSRPGVPGLQTDGFATATGTSSEGVGAVASGGSFLTITPGEPTITTQVVDEEVPAGEPVVDSATLAGGASPTGELTFDLYGPDDEDCSGEPVASTTHAVDGAGTYTSPAALVEEPGQYRFVARYGGDDDDLPVSGSCNDPNESVAVTAAEPPGLRVRNEATPLSRPEPGGTFAFDVEVTNTSAVRLTLTGLTDDVYGDVSTQGTCTDAVGTVLAPGDAYTCAFAGDLAGNAGTTQTSVVTGAAVDDEGTAVTDDDDATVSLTDVPPTVAVAKTALPEEQVAPGGLFTFGLAITNTSTEPVTVTGLSDDAYGDLARLTGSSCAELLGTVVAPGEERTCTFTGELTGEVGATHTNVVTVTVTDDEGSEGTAQDDATIRLVAPGATTTSTTTAVPSTTAPGTTPTTASGTTATTTARVTSTSLAKTGDRTRTVVVQGLLLVGAGMVLTGLGQGRTPRRRSG
jgi:hypothetical protein